MDALNLFSKYAPNKTFIAVFLGALAGLFYAFLIPVVMKSLSEGNIGFPVEDAVQEVLGFEVTNLNLATFFFGLCVAILLLKACSEILLARLSLHIRFVLRKELYRRVQNSPIASLESVGPSRLIQALSSDVTSIVDGAQLFPQILTNGVTLIGMLGYLAYLDFNVFVFVVSTIIFGVVAYQIPIMIGTKYFIKAREHRDVLQEAFRGLVEGAKELKLSQVKTAVYNNEVLYKEEYMVRDLEKSGMTIFSLAMNFGALLCFFTIGGLGFIFINYYAISSTEIIASIMVLLYVTGPIGMILNFIPQLAQTQISLKKIETLYSELPDENISKDTNEIGAWNKLKLKNVVYRYPLMENQNISFEVGPLSFEIKRGQITFIAGGNGSGKSTLAKLVTQHYFPTSGSIFYDDTQLCSKNLTSFRNEISSIYSDYYLFDRFLNEKVSSQEDYKQIKHYLELFGIANKVQLENGLFTTLRLSDGQRRRLALVVSIVENKSLFLFDEWAADQDPRFKEVFYREILPELKSRNKAVVVISHDDRYFDVADQLLIMESGNLTNKSKDQIVDLTMQDQSKELVVC
ncbi:cyclic peptide export ABC transporter [Rheinheimera gaetbuli]